MTILLDIDGVMTQANSWKRPELLKDGFTMFNTRAVQALNKIINQTNAGILLTTSHKAVYSLQEWKNIFSARGIRVANIQSLPENIDHLNRKDEILNWFNINTIPEDFVIIDDDKSLNDLPPFLKEKLVLTSSSIGLTDELANKAIGLLKRENQPVLV